MNIEWQQSYTTFAPFVIVFLIQGPPSIRSMDRLLVVYRLLGSLTSFRLPVISQAGVEETDLLPQDTSYRRRIIATSFAVGDLASVHNCLVWELLVAEDGIEPSTLGL